jgi:O-antigen ligase
MSATVPFPASEPSPRQRLANTFRAALEAVVLLLVCFAPWPFGSVHPFFEFILLAGIAVVLALWSLSILVEWQFTWKRCPVILCLGGLIVIGVLQLAPLSPSVRSSLSPAEEKLLAQLKPATPEEVIPGQPHEMPHLAAGSTLSLYPGGTRLAVLRLLAVFLLFAAVRNTYASKESLRRLGLVCLVNGAALALFALYQFFTAAAPHIIFGNIPTGGQVFGPFINRNHFAFFVNICICLTGGLLAAHWLGRTQGIPWNAFLEHGPTMWLSFLGLLMLASLAFCLSRGGLLALFLGCVAAVAVRWASTARRSWQGPIWVAILLLGFGSLAWYILPSVEARLATLRHDSVEDSRLSVWACALRISRDYPLTGSGYGTFGFLEPSYRSPGADPRVTFTFAHNEYLEAAAEGGILRLLVTVAVVAVVFVLAVRAYRRYQGHPSGGWVLGALAAFTAVAVHSFFDFGLHIPAVALLTAVFTAHIAALGARRTPDNRQHEITMRLFGFGPLLAASALLVLAGALVSEGWRLSQAERFRLAAQSRDIHRASDSHAPQVEYLETAVRYAPEDAALWVALAEAHLWQAEYTDEPGHNTAAAQELLIARDLCPVMRQPHVKLAGLTRRVPTLDAAPAYMERATLLAPTDPYLWYLRGAAEQDAHHEDAAWKCWRRSLELSESQLPAILRKLGDKPDAQAVADQLPDNPEILIHAAKLLYPDQEDRALREPLLRRAATLLQQQGGIKAKALLESLQREMQ